MSGHTNWHSDGGAAMRDGRKILVVATKGAGSNDEARILALLRDHDVEAFPFDRNDKRANILRMLQTVARKRPALIVMEGTGAAGGLAVILARTLLRTPFVLSSGDAVGPFLSGTHRVIGLPAWIYEWSLYRMSAGFIGWTPYLVGRALTLGAPRAVTAAGFVLATGEPLSRPAIRERIGVPVDAYVFGIVGSLDWNQQKGYCYGYELVSAIRRSSRRDVAVVVIGAGSGLDRLKVLAGDDLGRRVFLPGPIAADQVVSHLAAMDVGSIPQSLDQVGAFRYTTKISEYIAARLPIVTGRLPLAYDIAQAWSWRLPGSAPWSEEYIAALTSLMERVDGDDIESRRRHIPFESDIFDQSLQAERVGAFIRELLDDL
jgi:hypothetical protein